MAAGASSATCNFVAGFVLQRARMAACSAARRREVYRSCRIFRAASACSEKFQGTVWALWWLWLRVVRMAAAFYRNLLPSGWLAFLGLGLFT